MNAIYNQFITEEHAYLAVPGKAFEESFREYALSYEAIHDRHYFSKYQQALDNFDEYLDRFLIKNDNHKVDLSV